MVNGITGRETRLRNFFKSKQRRVLEHPYRRNADKPIRCDVNDRFFVEDQKIRHRRWLRRLNRLVKHFGSRHGEWVIADDFILSEVRGARG
jgi:hypothetical protein